MFKQITMRIRLKNDYVDLEVKKDKGDDLIRFYVDDDFITQFNFNQINAFVEFYYCDDMVKLLELNTYSATIKEFVKLLTLDLLSDNHAFSAKVKRLKHELNLDNDAGKCEFYQAVVFTGFSS